MIVESLLTADIQLTACKQELMKRVLPVLRNPGIGLRRC